MSDTHSFETHLRWPADPAQALPPASAFSRNNVLSATGTLGLGGNGIKNGPPGKMSMQEVTLRPRVTVANGTDLADARAMHERAHANCFIANSINFPVRYEAEIVAA